MPTPGPRQPSSFLERDNWIRAVLASDLPHVAARVALAIGAHLHVKSGRCDPSFAGIAVASHVSERTVYRLVSLLEHTGWIAMQRTGGRQRNHYTLLNPVTATSGFNHDKTPSGFDDANPDTALSASTLTEFASNPDTKVAVKKRRTAKKEREGNIYPEPSDVASRDVGQDTREPDRKSSGDGNNATRLSASAKGGDGETVTTITSADIAAAFAEFWVVYPLKVGKLDTEKAYFAKAKAGTPSAVMNAGAKRYAAERSGQDPKFTKHPAKWIKGECWNDEPSSTGAVTIDNNTGNVIAQADQKQSADDYLKQLIGPHKNWYGT